MRDLNDGVWRSRKEVGQEHQGFGTPGHHPLTLAPQRSRPIGVRLRVDELHGPPPAGELARTAVVVADHPQVEIVCLTDVQHAIGAAQRADVVHVR